MSTPCIYPPRIYLWRLIKQGYSILHRRRRGDEILVQKPLHFVRTVFRLIRGYRIFWVFSVPTSVILAFLLISPYPGKLKKRWKKYKEHKAREKQWRDKTPILGWLPWKKQKKLTAEEEVIVVRRVNPRQARRRSVVLSV